MHITEMPKGEGVKGTEEIFATIMPGICPSSCQAPNLRSRKVRSKVNAKTTTMKDRTNPKPTIATRHIIFKQQKNQRHKEKNLKKEKDILQRNKGRLTSAMQARRE